jgi:multimeric flavodoxin WrbA
MNILLLTGSPHRHGTSALLADEFTRGAQESGHTVTRFDAAFEDIHACIACERCHNTDKGCVFQDGMTKLNPLLMAADAVVFVSPIYYYDWSAQLKLAIDRFYANTEALCASSKQAALLLTMADDTMESAAGAIQSFEGMTNYLGWQRRGVIAALACLDVESMKQTDYPQKAYELGKTF